MAYYGILMKDGTELTHYGVKGMKWGKSLFGKVKGVFGTPRIYEKDFPMTQKNLDKRYSQYKSAYNSQVRKTTQAWEDYDNGKIPLSKAAQAARQAYRTEQMLVNRYNAERSREGSDIQKDGEKWDKVYANRIKRNSKRINGR